MPLTARYWIQENGSVFVDDGVFRGEVSFEDFERLRSVVVDDKDWVEQDGELPKLGWMVREYQGVEIYRPPPGLTVAEVKDRTKWPKDFVLTPVKTPKLKVGDLLLVPGLFGGMFLGFVRGDPDGNPYFQSEGGSMIGYLEFRKDDRDCWVCGGLGNLEAIQRLELKR
jgi:hypothetical protein